MKALKIGRFSVNTAKNLYRNNISVRFFNYSSLADIKSKNLRFFKKFWTEEEDHSKPEKNAKYEKILTKISPTPDNSLFIKIPLFSLIVVSPIYINKFFALDLAATNIYWAEAFAFGLYVKISRAYKKKYELENSLKTLFNIREISQEIKEIRKVKQQQNKKDLVEIFEKKEMLNESYKIESTFTNGEKKIFELLVAGLDPRLAEFWLLKSKINSNSPKIVKALLNEGIVTKLDGETSAIDYALEVCPKNSEVTRLLTEHEKKTELSKQIQHLSEPCLSNKKVKKPPAFLYSRKLVYSRRN